MRNPGDRGPIYHPPISPGHLLNSNRIMVDPLRAGPPSQVLIWPLYYLNPVYLIQYLPIQSQTLDQLSTSIRTSNPSQIVEASQSKDLVPAQLFHQVTQWTLPCFHTHLQLTRNTHLSYLSHPPTHSRTGQHHHQGRDLHHHNLQGQQGRCYSMEDLQEQPYSLQG